MFNIYEGLLIEPTFPSGLAGCSVMKVILVGYVPQVLW